MVRAGCVFVAGIHPSRTWTSGSFESVRWNACVHRLDLGLYSHLKEFFGEWSLNPCQLQGKNPLYRKMSPEEDRTRDAVDSETKHYQLSYSGPLFIHMNSLLIAVISLVHLASQPTGPCISVRQSILCGKNFDIGHYTQSFKPNSFTSAMHVGPIGHCHFVPLSVNIALVRGHKISRMQNLLILFSCTLLNWLGWNGICYWSSSS